MKKTLVGPETPTDAIAAQWLNLENLAEAELTSEDPSFPLEAALRPGEGVGWRAAGPGPQVLRLIFTQPHTIRRIFLQFEEPALERTQEFALRWSRSPTEPLRKILRQQWNFSASGSQVEVEDLTVDLPGLCVFELEIIPDIGGGEAVASLKKLRLGQAAEISGNQEVP